MATAIPITLAHGGEAIQRILADVPSPRRMIGMSQTVGLLHDGALALQAFVATEEDVADAKRRGLPLHGLNDESGALFDATVKAFKRVLGSAVRLEGDHQARLAARLVLLQLGLQDQEDRAYVLGALLEMRDDILLKDTRAMAQSVNRTIRHCFTLLRRLEVLQLGLASQDADVDDDPALSFGLEAAAGEDRPDPGFF
jgi:hypothetical protein